MFKSPPLIGFSIPFGSEVTFGMEKIEDVPQSVTYDSLASMTIIRQRLLACAPSG